MQSQIFLVLSTMVAFSLGGEVQEPQSARKKEQLIVITLAADLVEGKYYSDYLRGIHFISKDGSVSITALDNEDTEQPLFNVSRPAGPNNASLVSVLDYQFLLVNFEEEEELVDYSVPPSMSDKATEAADSPNRNKMEKLLPKLSLETSTNREKVFAQLLSHPNFQLIEAAALAMGDVGITGEKYPAALTFYMTALRVAKQFSGSEPEPQVSRSKRGIIDWLFGTKRCHHGYTCPKYRCPRYKSYNPCFGLCGTQCNCWRWVCGDCCWHLGCYAHDTICTIAGGTSSWKCWVTAPIALIC